MRRPGPALTVALALALAVVGCGDSDGGAAPPLPVATSAPTTMVIVTPTDVDGLTSAEGVGDRTTAPGATANPPVARPSTPDDGSDAESAEDGDSPGSGGSSPRTSSSSTTTSTTTAGARRSSTTTTRPGAPGGGGGGGGGDQAGLSPRTARSGTRDVTTIELAEATTVSVEEPGNEPRSVLRYDLPAGASADVLIDQFVELDDGDVAYGQVFEGTARLRGRSDEGFVIETAIDTWTLDDESEPPIADADQRRAAFEDMFIDQVVAPNGSPVSISFDLPAGAASVVDVALLTDLALFTTVLPDEAVGGDAIWTSTVTRDVDGVRLITEVEEELLEIEEGCLDTFTTGDGGGSGSGVTIDITIDGGASTCLMSFESAVSTSLGLSRSGASGGFQSASIDTFVTVG